MTATTKYAQILRVSVKQGDKDVFVATSSSLKGLLVVSKDYRMLLDVLIPQAITDLYAAFGQELVVARLDEKDIADDNDSLPFVAMPANIAREALETMAGVSPTARRA